MKVRSEPWWGLQMPGVTVGLVIRVQVPCIVTPDVDVYM
jgi:hypothetical protein